VLWIIDPHKALDGLAGAADAIRAVAAGSVDAVVMHDAFIVANRMRALPATTGLRGYRDARQRRLARRLAAGGLRLDVQQVESTMPARPRWFAAFLPRRAPSSTTRP
jgi:hypothetical protein